MSNISAAGKNVLFRMEQLVRENALILPEDRVMVALSAERIQSCFCGGCAFCLRRWDLKCAQHI